MDALFLKTLYSEYQQKIGNILKEYGIKEGFIIKGELWWDYYKKLIDTTLNKINENTLTLQDATCVYKEFGFGPKLYGNSFVENGLDPIKRLFKYWADDSISAKEKIMELVEEPESENYVKGVGINFITLFLTTCYPTKYVQWNIQTNGALKLLGVYPQKKYGEKKSDFYIKINRVCLELQRTVGLDSLTRLDNFLYCLNKGYIGNPKKLEKEYAKETKKIEQLDDIVPSAQEVNQHDEMMYYLVKIGIYKNHDVFVAVDNKNKEVNGEKFPDLCLKELPSFTQPTTLATAKYIDVIWFKKGTSHPVRFFEIEHSTSVYSGLLRLNDVKIDYPINKATVVIPQKRKDLFETQIERRTFKYSELFDICDYLTYEDLKKWYEAVKVDVQYA